MKEKTKKIINTTFLLLFVGSIIIGFSIGGVVNLGDSSSNVQKYGSLKFTKKGNLWSTYINNKEAQFIYYPTDVTDLVLDGETISLLTNKYEIDATSGFNDTLKESIAYSEYELGNMMKFHFSSYLRAGYTENNTYNMPIITCNQSSQIVPVIYFVYGNETKITREGTCIIANAKSSNDMIRIKDRLLYAMLGILK